MKKRKFKVYKVVSKEAQYKSSLKNFWKRFEKAVTQTEKIQLLKKYSKCVIYKPDNDWLKIKRNEFNKFFNQYYGSKCFVCGYKKFIRHHIIQLKNGGDNNGSNIIALCNYCHAQIHPHLLDLQCRAGNGVTSLEVAMTS